MFGKTKISVSKFRQHKEDKKDKRKWRPISVILMEGPLMKLSASRCGEWRERWFELRNNMLLFYKEVGDAQACGIVPLHDCEVTAVLASGMGGGAGGGGGGEKGEEGGYAYAGMSEDKLRKCFRVYHPQRRTFFLMAKNDNKMKHWVSSIKAAMIGDNFFGDECSLESSGSMLSIMPTNNNHNHTDNNTSTGESRRDSMRGVGSLIVGPDGETFVSSRKKKRLHRRRSFVHTISNVTLEGYMRCRCFPPPPPSSEFLSKFKMEVQSNNPTDGRKPTTRKATRKNKASLALNKESDLFGGYDLGKSRGKRQTWYFILRDNVLYILQNKMVSFPSLLLFIIYLHFILFITCFIIISFTYAFSLCCFFSYVFFFSGFRAYGCCRCIRVFHAQTCGEP